MSVSKSFILAGHAIFTIQFPGEHVDAHGGRHTHYTYRVDHKDASSQYPEAYFVKLLTGPDNTANYSYLGMLDKLTGSVRLTGKSCVSENSYSYKLLVRVLARVWADDHAAYEAHGYKTHHEGECGRCGRVLTTPESIERGIGPICARKMGLVVDDAEVADEVADLAATK